MESPTPKGGEGPPCLNIKEVFFWDWIERVRRGGGSVLVDPIPQMALDANVWSGAL